MKNLGSPKNIGVLLHFHISPEPHPRHEFVKDDISTFAAEGFIEPCSDNPGCYKTTPKGQAWVKMLCELPPPREAFVDEMDRVIKV